MVSDLQSSHVLISRWAISGFPTRLRPGKAISTRNGNVSTKTAVATVALSGPWESSHGASVLRAINTALTKWPQSKEVWDFEMAWNSHYIMLCDEKNNNKKSMLALRRIRKNILGLFKFKYKRSVKKTKNYTKLMTPGQNCSLFEYYVML